jgi:hypothetical protein
MKKEEFYTTTRFPRRRNWVEGKRRRGKLPIYRQ